ncbi:MAG TPA: metallophosphoesterase family protein [Thermoplasmata archaeon]|nr:metallophosphoesterase family protein [Thermoplasmata archaeon]
MTDASAPISPEDILALDAPGADRLLGRLEASVPTWPPLARLSTQGFREAIVFGDSHGDWHSVREVEHRFESGGVARMLIGLGDYVDRVPGDCPHGSVANALHLLALSAKYPDRVLLIQGNHEAARRIRAFPHDVPQEVEELWGPDRSRYDRLMGLLERGPLAVVLPNGVYCAHAGFPLVSSSDQWAHAFDSLAEEGLLQLLWAECDVSRNRRGAGVPWGGRDLERFFRSNSLRIFLRGHDPDITGQPLFEGRCMTLQTTRVYQRFGGVIVARVPLGHPLESLRDVVIEHLSSEGQTYPVFD